MSERWWPRRDPDPGPRVRAVAVEGGNPRHRRWERTADGWAPRGITISHARHTPARPWCDVGDRPDHTARCPRCGEEYACAVVDVTASLGELCAECDGYGCFGCGWDGRIDRAAASTASTIEP